MLQGNALVADADKKNRKLGSVQIIHATNDADISVEQGKMLFSEAFKDTIHSGHDGRITVEKGESLFTQLTGSEKISHTTGEVIARVGSSPSISLNIVQYGGKLRLLEIASDDFVSDVHKGHNRIVTYAPVALAVMRAFEGR